VKPKETVPAIFLVASASRPVPARQNDAGRFPVSGTKPTVLIGSSWDHLCIQSDPVFAAGSRFRSSLSSSPFEGGVRVRRSNLGWVLGAAGIAAIRCRTGGVHPALAELNRGAGGGSGLLRLWQCGLRWQTRLGPSFCGALMLDQWFSSSPCLRLRPRGPALRDARPGLFATGLRLFELGHRGGRGPVRQHIACT